MVLVYCFLVDYDAFDDNIAHIYILQSEEEGNKFTVTVYIDKNGLEMNINDDIAILFL